MYIQLDQVINCDNELELFLRDNECEHLNNHYTAILSDELAFTTTNQITFFERLTVPIVIASTIIHETTAQVTRDINNHIWITKQEYDQLFVLEYNIGV